MWLKRVVLGIALTTFCVRSEAEPRIRVAPIDVIEGEPVQVVVEGLQPGQSVTLRTSRLWPAYPSGEEQVSAWASFTADAEGIVDLGKREPLAGSSYQGTDASGLFWSMSRQPDSILAWSDGQGLRAGRVVIEAESQGRVVARTEARLRIARPGVTVREVREPGVTGVLARDGRLEGQPAVIVLGGSEGGLFTARWAAPIIASHGYAVLGLAYFRGDEPNLTDLPINLENIPLEQLERAREYLARQPGVDTTRIAIVGVSKGAEMALLAASRFAWVDVVAAFAPSHVVWEGIPPPDRENASAGSSWTYRGRPLRFVRWSRSAERRGDNRRATTGSSRLTEVHLESLVEFASDVPAALIPIERSRAAIFIAAGTDDGMWPSAFAAEQLRNRVAERASSLPISMEIHPTGHQVMGSGWGPTTQFQRTTGRLQGGNAQLDSQAQRTIWPAFLAFLEEHLRSAH